MLAEVEEEVEAVQVQEDDEPPEPVQLPSIRHEVRKRGEGTVCDCEADCPVILLKPGWTEEREEPGGIRVKRIPHMAELLYMEAMSTSRSLISGILAALNEVSQAGKWTVSHQFEGDSYRVSRPVSIPARMKLRDTTLRLDANTPPLTHMAALAQDRTLILARSQRPPAKAGGLSLEVRRPSRR